MQVAPSAASVGLCISRLWVRIADFSLRVGRDNFHADHRRFVGRPRLRAERKFRACLSSFFPR